MDHDDVDLAARLRACMRRWHVQSGDRLSGGSTCFLDLFD